MKRKKGLRPQASGLSKKKKATKKPAKRKARARPKTASRKPAAGSRKPASRWVEFVKKHGVVLASARGPVPSVAEAVVGEPIIGSWWAHPKGKAIFAALSAIDDSPDVRCFKLIDGKITLVHRRAWPALVRLARDGALAAERLAAVQQQHMPDGEHRNIVTPFPAWVDDATSAAADKISAAQAKKTLPAL